MGKGSRGRAAAAVEPLKLDFGCGGRKQAGFLGVDRLAMPGVDFVADLSSPRWIFKKARGPQFAADGSLRDGSVSEGYAAHFLEHLTGLERIRFVNELYRVLMPGGTCQIIVPHWSSCRAYGDPTHQWPPIGEFWPYYLRRAWRLGGQALGDPTVDPQEAQAPHTDVSHWAEGLSCDFETTYSYTIAGPLATRAGEHQQFAIQHYKDAVQDFVMMLTKH